MTLQEEVPMIGAEEQGYVAVPPKAFARKRRRGVLFIIGTLDLGGTESQLVLLAKELKARGWKVEVFALSQGGVLAETLNRAGIRVLYGLHRPNLSPAPPASANGLVKSSVALKTRPSVKAMLVLGAAVASLVIRIVLTRPHVVQAFLPLTNFLGALAGRIALAPLVITSRRALGNHQERWPRAKRMDRIANRLSHVVIANSHAVAVDTAARDKYDIDSIKVIPNGLDLSRFDDISHRRDEARRRLGLGPGEVGIVIVANLIPYKGHSDLIEAFARASEKLPNLRLFMAGQDRGIGPALAEQAKRLGVESKVQALGTQNDVPGLLAGMDVGVIASHEEGFCNALMEKLAAGLPVVATNVGGNPEAVSGMPGCILVDPREPADLARGLLTVIDRLPEQASDREFRQRTMRERYSTGAMVDAYERLYLADD
ncbi:glycosyltransferase [Mesorhizobium dulcispinae]|uniref:glycosyltransferase n=1 Tax=Mesorhizobium dulcispinae TaxID=3072316 RepID=UPI002A24DC71|nr:glycosyltransferase [Mesorhizobium sp. VK23D]MDX8520161.1 glycosyltransferase [Mesorhizobium sp. VK23D]